MSSTSSHLGSNSSHHAPNEGHDKTDFNWTLVLWSLPAGVLILVGFTLICLFFFRGYHDDEFRLKQSLFPTTDLNAQKLADSEVLSQYKILDKDLDKVQIPISKAMERLVQENLNVSGRDWKPITDIYLEGAAFVQEAGKSIPQVHDLIIIEDSKSESPEKISPPSNKHGH